MSPPLVCIVGPTANGKTGLAIELCRRFGGEIVGCDASQVYRGLDIGTGKATAEELDGIPHHLIDVVPPNARFDAAEYQRRADAAIADIHGRGRRAFVVGGTGLYLRALLQGLCAAPPLDPDIRARLHARIAGGELGAMHAELAVADPVMAARLAPADRQRIERALGVYLTTGRPLSAWQAEHRFAERRHPARIVVVDRPRPLLRGRIEARVQAFFDAGWVDEVRGLLAAGHGPWLQSLSALGYRLIARALAGEMTMAEAQAATVRATQRYAKRQGTWFRGIDADARLDGAVGPDAVAPYCAVDAAWGVG